MLLCSRLQSVAIGCCRFMGVAVRDTDLSELNCNASVYHSAAISCRGSVDVVFGDTDFVELDSCAFCVRQCCGWLWQVCGRVGNIHELDCITLLYKTVLCVAIAGQWVTVTLLCKTVL